MKIPHIRKGHYRRVGSQCIWIRATIIHIDAFFINFHLLEKEQQDKYYETFLFSNRIGKTFSAIVANTIYTNILKEA